MPASDDRHENNHKNALQCCNKTDLIVKLPPWIGVSDTACLHTHYISLQNTFKRFVSVSLCFSVTHYDKSVFSKFDCVFSHLRLDSRWTLVNQNNMSSIEATCDCIYCPAKNQAAGGVCRIKYDSAGIERCQCDECDGDCDGTLNGACGTCYDAESCMCVLCACCNEIHTSGGTYMDLYEVGSRDILEAEEKKLAEKKLAEQKLAEQKRAEKKRAEKKTQRGIKKVTKNAHSVAALKQAIETMNLPQGRAISVKPANKGPCLVCGIGMTKLDVDRIRMHHDRLLGGVQVEGLAVDSLSAQHGYVHRHCISGPTRKPRDYRSVV